MALYIEEHIIEHLILGIDALMDNSMADTLHRHSELSASDGTPDRALVVDATGNVGIGTTSPLATLHLNKSDGNEILTLSRPSYPDVDFKVTNILGGGDSALIIDANAYDFRIGGASSKLVMMNNGNVGIGTTGPNYKLEISTDSAGKPGAGGLWTVVSDERIKENIELADLDRCQEIIKTLPLKRFGFKVDCFSDEQIKDRNVLGWVAQDVKPIFPKAVNIKGNIEKVKTPAVLDEDGNIITEEVKEIIVEDCLDLNGGQIIAVMYGALQKSILQIEELKAEIELLKQPISI